MQAGFDQNYFQSPTNIRTHAVNIFSLFHSKVQLLVRHGQSTGAGSIAPGKWQEKLRK